MRSVASGTARAEVSEMRTRPHRMKRLFLIAALAACSGDPSSPAPLAAHLSVQRRQVMFGDTLRVELRFTNNTANDITYQANTCNRHFEVLDASGRLVGPNERVYCTAEVVLATLRRGATITLTGFFTGTAPDLTMGPLPGPVTFLPAGKYTIRPALLLLPSGERFRGAPITIELMRYLPD